MRRKRDPQQFIEWPGDKAPKTVAQYRQTYKRLSDLLDEVPWILTRVSHDLCTLSGSSPRGRKGVYSVEQILRAVIVHQLEGTSLRETVIRISESETLRSFIRLGNQPVMDHSFLDRCIQALSEETWAAINTSLARYAVKTERICPSRIRTDTTVIETNIHYPTDAWLLWDSWRVLARVLGRIRQIAPPLCPHRFHTQKAKKLFLFITRYTRSTGKARRRAVKRKFRTLIERVEWIAEVAQAVALQARCAAQVELLAFAEEIEGILPAVRTVCSTSRRAQLRGETVPARDRVFSLFEPHTELIKRGKRSAPVEFGHSVQFTQTPEKFITAWRAMEIQQPDNTLAADTVQQHCRIFRKPPDGMTADGGFWPGEEAMQALSQKVSQVAIPRRVTDWCSGLLKHWQGFRAGIEGTISVLKRAYRLCRCLYRGFKRFASAIGMAVFCHNLMVLAQPGVT